MRVVSSFRLRVVSASRIGDIMASTSQLKAAGFAEDEQAALLKIKDAYGVKATKDAIKEEKGSLGFMKYIKSNTHTVRRGHTLDGPSRLPLTLSSTSRPALPSPPPPPSPRARTPRTPPAPQSAHIHPHPHPLRPLPAGARRSSRRRSSSTARR